MYPDIEVDYCIDSWVVIYSLINKNLKNTDLRSVLQSQVEHPFSSCLLPYIQNFIH